MEFCKIGEYSVVVSGFAIVDNVNDGGGPSRFDHRGILTSANRTLYPIADSCSKLIFASLECKRYIMVEKSPKVNLQNIYKRM